MSAPRFTPKSLSFLRSLKRNNDREWFRERKDQYDELLKAPMLAVIEQLAIRLPGIRAGDWSPPRSASTASTATRASRTTRRRSRRTSLRASHGVGLPSPSGRRPLHRDRAAVGVGRRRHVRARTSQLAAVREHIAANHTRLQRDCRIAWFQEGRRSARGRDELQRVPRGYRRRTIRQPNSCDTGSSWRPRSSRREFACDPSSTPGVLGVFRQVAPLIRFLNEPLTGHTHLKDGLRAGSAALM